MKPLRATDPATIDNWTLLGRLGEGGQGVVYLARHTTDPREYADTGAETDEASRDTTPGEIGSVAAMKLFKEIDTKFLAKELAAISQISGTAGCAQVIATGELNGQPWIATEYVDGPDLFTSVSQAGPIHGELLTTLAVATATALAAIHRAGVVHRDFKPSNVLLGPDGPVVIDFGVAHLLESAGTTSNIVGTPSYAAPEQLAGHKAAPPADVFAWACTVAFAATGHPPFGADSIPAVMHRILYAPPDLDGIPQTLQHVLAACLHKDPAARPAAEQVVANLLANAGSDDDVLAAAHTFIHTKVLPAPVPPPASHPATPRPVRTRRYLVGATVGVWTAAVIAGVVLAAFGLATSSSPSPGDSATTDRLSPIPVASGGQSQGQTSSASAVPITAAQYAARIMAAIGAKRGCSYTHDLVIPQGDGLSKSSGILYTNPGGATDYYARVVYPDPNGVGPAAATTASVTIIGNTAYDVDTTGQNSYKAWDIGPSGHGVPPDVITAIDARWVSSPYTIDSLLTHATTFSVSTQDSQLMLTGSLPTTAMEDTPTGGLFKELDVARVTRFQISLQSDYLPQRVEMHFTDVSADHGGSAVGGATATATFTGWGLQGPITVPQ